MKHIKFFLIISFLVFITSISQAQTFFGDGQKYFHNEYWKHGSGCEYCVGAGIETIYLDSTIADTEYYSVKYEDKKYFIKQSNNRVYIKGSSYSDFPNDSIYHLLYDFNLKEGDSLSGNLPPFTEYNKVNLLMKFHIDSVRQLNFGGESRIVQYLTGHSGYVLQGNLIFVEGIGSLHGGIQHFIGAFGEWGSKLGVVCNNDSLLYWNHVRNYHGDPTCDFSKLYRYASIANTSQLSQIKIYPNPANEILNIEVQDNAPFQFQIINSLGQVIKTGFSSLTESPAINISHLQKGIYFIKLKTKDRLFLEKILKG